MSYVSDEIRKSAELFEEKNKLYGDTYKRQGEIMMLLFPYGLNTTNSKNFNRIGIMNKIVDKLIRYSANYSQGGHEDSLTDISIYAQMLKELDNE